MEGFLSPIKQLFEGPKVDVVNLNAWPKRKILTLAGVGLLIVLGLVLTGFVADARGKFLPGTLVENVPLGGLTLEEATLKIQEAQLTPPEHTIALTAQENSIASSSAELNAHYEFDQALTQQLANQQSKPLDWLSQLLFNQQSSQPGALPIFYGADQLRTMVTALKQTVDDEPQPPSVTLTYSGNPESIAVEPGQDAFELNFNLTLDQLTNQLNAVTSQTIAEANDQPLTFTAVIDQISRQLTEDQVAAAKDRTAKLVGEKLVFEKDHLKRTLTDRDLVAFLNLPDGFNETTIDEQLQSWATELNRSPSNAEFVYDPQTLVVSTFVPDRKGLTLDLTTMKASVLEGLKELEGTDTNNLPEATITKELALQEAEPEITLAETNDLGIVERIGFGESYYYHSIPTRIHNVSLTTQKISLALVKPGEEFSFNKTLGDVSAVTGFKPAYVIKDGQTVLGDGGGVCQVSSTLFRSLLDAGLNITRRLQHSYRVSYYELDSQPGFDATVYAGNVDLRFINDTNRYVLIYGQADSSNLYMTMEIYGSSDGRTTEVTNYQSWDPRPPLATVYVPDPSLAPGELRQIDWSASGIKAKFTHIVRDKDGKIISEKEYYSNYRSWAAKFLQGV